MQTVSFRNSEARGRNGWFRMASASLYAARGRINVDVVSKRAVCPGPVCLELSPEEALAQAMLNHAQAVLHPPAAVRVLVRAGVADWCAAGMRIPGQQPLRGNSRPFSLAKADTPLPAGWDGRL